MARMCLSSALITVAACSSHNANVQQIAPSRAAVRDLKCTGNNTFSVGDWSAQHPQDPSFSMDSPRQGSGGGISAPRLTESGVIRRFERAALEHLGSTVFKPGMMDGQPVRSLFCVPVNYLLTGG